MPRKLGGLAGWHPGAYLLSEVWWAAPCGGGEPPTKVGGAQVSEKHAGFVVNRGGASFDDVLRLIEHIQNEVYRVSGIELEPEVKIIRE